MNKELDILLWIQNHLRSPFLDKIMLFLSSQLILYIFLLLICVLLIYKKRKQEVYILLGTIIVACVFAVTFKHIFGRLRPCVIYPYVDMLVKETSYSFPSSHATLTFSAMATLAYFHKRYAFLFLGFGLLIAFTRLYLFVHYPTDVLCGLVLGIAVSDLCLRIVKIK